MFKRNIFKILAVVFFLLAGATFYNSNKTISKKINTSPISPTEVSTNAAKKLKVSLTINGSDAGSIDMVNGTNQCDVLSQALSQGKIKSLDMRYNKDFKTSVVYLINGVGKKDSVWWVLKVNGQSPDQGCSYIKVKNRDKSEWSYLGK
ncbi:conserved exported hypothetical protein [Candidatus Roizmanbacteria bacterium]|nr:conserved exported hypothetical protein [Candidatus Roizmanbacteria bacterium]